MRILVFLMYHLFVFIFCHTQYKATYRIYAGEYRNNKLQSFYLWLSYPFTFFYFIRYPYRTEKLKEGMYLFRFMGIKDISSLAIRFNVVHLMILFISNFILLPFKLFLLIGLNLLFLIQVLLNVISKFSIIRYIIPKP
jgi:hypothetical protein